MSDVAGTAPPAHSGSRRRFFTPPGFDTEERTAVARRVWSMAWAIVGLALFNTLGPMLFTAPGPRWLILIAAGLAVGFTDLLLVRLGRVQAAAWFLTVSLWAYATVAQLTAGGVSAPSVSLQIVVVIAAGLVLGWRVGAGAAGVAIVTEFALAWLQVEGRLPVPSVDHTPWSRAWGFAGYTIAAAVIVAIVVQDMRRSQARALSELERRRATEAELRDAETQVRALNEDLERRVAERTSELQDALHELESFSYSVSHDLRTPLRGINGYATILETDYAGVLDDEGRRQLGRIRANTERMGELIDDLLRFSQLGRRQIAHRPVDMTSLARAAIDDVAPGSQSGDVTISLTELPGAEGDEALLREVWSNLLGNALKFSREGVKPCITIAGRDHADQSVFSVTDNGVGFDIRYGGKLFDVFERLHGSEYEGTGIGLAICRRIVEAHGGRIWCTSSAGEGSTFWFSLPHQREPAAPSDLLACEGTETSDEARAQRR